MLYRVKWRTTDYRNVTSPCITSHIIYSASFEPVLERGMTLRDMLKSIGVKVWKPPTQFGQFTDVKQMLRVRHWHCISGLIASLYATCRDAIFACNVIVEIHGSRTAVDIIISRRTRRFARDRSVVYLPLRTCTLQRNLQTSIRSPSTIPL